MITNKHAKAKNLSSDILSRIALLHKSIEALNVILEDTETDEWRHISYLTFGYEKELKRIRKKAEKLEAFLCY